MSKIAALPPRSPSPAVFYSLALLAVQRMEYFITSRVPQQNADFTRKKDFVLSHSLPRPQCPESCLVLSKGSVRFHYMNKRTASYRG